MSLETYYQRPLLKAVLRYGLLKLVWTRCVVADANT